MACSAFILGWSQKAAKQCHRAEPDDQQQSEAQAMGLFCPSRAIPPADAEQRYHAADGLQVEITANLPGFARWLPEK